MFAFRHTKSLARTIRVAAAARPACRAMSNSLHEKELGEEAIYFRKEEARKRAEMRAKMETIMALDDHHEEKKELLEILNKGEAAKDQGLINKLGLDDWRIAVPVGVIASMSMVESGVLLIGPESLLAAAFALFCASANINVGPMLSQFLEDYRKNVANDFAKIDQNLMKEVKENITATSQLLDLEKEFSDFQQLRDDLAIVQADNLNHAEQHKFRDSVAKKLDSLIAIEEAAVSSIRRRTIDTVQADVLKAFKTDKKIQEKALEHALTVLAGGVGSKRGKDVVGDVFAKSITSYRDAYSKTKPSEDPIIVQFEKDVAAVGLAPAISFQASNVYESHPLGGSGKH